jgi:hypothetical protein
MPLHNDAFDVDADTPCCGRPSALGFDLSVGRRTYYIRHTRMIAVDVACSPLLTAKMADSGVRPDHLRIVAEAAVAAGHCRYPVAQATAGVPAEERIGAGAVARTEVVAVVRTAAAAEEHNQAVAAEHTAVAEQAAAEAVAGTAAVASAQVEAEAAQVGAAAQAAVAAARLGVVAAAVVVGVPAEPVPAGLPGPVLGPVYIPVHKRVEVPVQAVPGWSTTLAEVVAPID